MRWWAYSGLLLTGLLIVGISTVLLNQSRMPTARVGAQDASTPSPSESMSASTGDTTAGSPSARITRNYSNKWGLSQSKTREILEKQPSFDTVASRARGRYPQTFAGAWTDTDEGRFKLAFTKDASESVRKVTPDRLTSLVDPVDVKYSQRKLRDTADTIISRSDNVVKTVVKVVENKVQVGVRPGSDATRNELEKAYPSDLISIEETEEIKPGAA